jgi:hypothetical protein
VELSDHAKALIGQQENPAYAKRGAFVDTRRNADATRWSPKGNPKQTHQHLTAPQASTVATNQAPTFSESLQVDGFSISASSSAATGEQSFVVTGPDGVQESYTASPDGDVTISSGGLQQAGFADGSSTIGNNIANFTLTEASATATSITSSTGDNSISAAAASAEYESISFSVNFITGTIQVQQTDQTLTESTAQVTVNTPVSKTA